MPPVFFLESFWAVWAFHFHVFVLGNLVGFEFLGSEKRHILCAVDTKVLVLLRFGTVPPEIKKKTAKFSLL